MRIDKEITIVYIMVISILIFFVFVCITNAEANMKSQKFSETYSCYPEYKPITPLAVLLNVIGKNAYCADYCWIKSSKAGTGPALHLWMTNCLEECYKTVVCE